MSLGPSPLASAPTREAVLSKAVSRSAQHMKLANNELAEVLGLSEATVSRLRRGDYLLKPRDKSFELAQLLVRLFRGLDAITGGDDRSTQSWLRSDNLVLGAKPAEMIKTIRGLASVVAYVDSQRALS